MAGLAWEGSDAGRAGRPFELLGAQPPTAAGPGQATLRVGCDLRAEDLARALVPSMAQRARMFDEGLLTRGDGRALGRADGLSAGEEARLSLRVTRVPGPTSDVPVSVLHEDAFLLVADKPAGILVHGDGTGAETLTARVQGHLRREGSAAVPQALMRLDVETSGIVLFSLAEETQPAFDALVAGEGVRKRYLAVVSGRLDRLRALPGDEQGWHEVEAPIARDRHDARRMRVGRTGKPSRTKLRVLDKAAGQALVEAELVTGRRHQIRVHLAHLGLPIVGDALYGEARSAGGLLLHAWSVALVHPVTGERVALSTGYPARFPEALARPDGPFSTV